ncbi:lysine-rich arabinogalactan protein 19-like [Cryptomeria japonica]|uniref:lysine-rich arabinogalactan protein 19-like n=1 Tax=Cryptomeria japonica TaxID=3369 RepID=UPI0027DA7EF3|nr:lysine-rich arabinogalactan protein 19-like [Cryptomeria japonica]
MQSPPTVTCSSPSGHRPVTIASSSLQSGTAQPAALTACLVCVSRAACSAHHLCSPQVPPNSSSHAAQLLRRPAPTPRSSTHRWDLSTPPPMPPTDPPIATPGPQAAIQPPPKFSGCYQNFLAVVKLFRE